MMHQAYGQNFDMFSSTHAFISERKRPYSGEQTIPEVKRRRYNEEVNNRAIQEILLHKFSSILFTPFFLNCKFPDLPNSLTVCDTRFGGVYQRLPHLHEGRPLYYCGDK